MVTLMMLRILMLDMTMIVMLVLNVTIMITRQKMLL